MGPRPIHDDRVRRSTACLIHRGPDDHGSWQSRTDQGMFICLVHTRLSILDLDRRAAQPMHWRGLSLVFNGEVYNYRELRSSLERLGVEFETRSDTEVLLKGIGTFGWNFLDRAEGMWALALFDSNTETLSLSRDRFGEKPLWFASDEDSVAFSSTVSALSEISGRRFYPDMEKMRRFIVLGYRAVFRESGSFLEGVQEVPAGSLLHFRRGKEVQRIRYWELPNNVDREMGFDEAVVQCRRFLTESVDLRLRSDAPLAFSLSGGVDSVVLAALARHEMGATVHGFTIRNTDARYDEQEHVETAIQTLGLKHTWVDLQSNSFNDDITEMTEGRGAPILTLSSYAQHQLMAQIGAEGYKVVVGGTGADEVFSGYYDHHLFYLASIDRERRLEAVRFWERVVRPHVRNPFLQDPEAMVINPDERRHIYMYADGFNKLLTSPIDVAFVEEDFDGSPLRNRLRNELFSETVPVLLHEEDLNAMAASVENRSPYLDRNLVEFAFTVPVEHLVRRGLAKAVLREAGRLVAPDQILDNPRKVGFNVPLTYVLDFGDSRTSESLFGESQVWSIVDQMAFRDLVGSGTDTNSLSKFAFNVLSAKAFLDAWA